MTDKKIPDIKELMEYKARVGCQNCDLIGKGYCGTCVNSLIKSFIGLFDRLQEEFEETKKRNKDLDYAIRSYKAEAYKEFAESVKCLMRDRYLQSDMRYSQFATPEDIDNLLKELVGEQVE